MKRTSIERRGKEEPSFSVHSCVEAEWDGDWLEATVVRVLHQSKGLHYKIEWRCDGSLSVLPADLVRPQSSCSCSSSSSSSSSAAASSSASCSPTTTTTTTRTNRTNTTTTTTPLVVQQLSKEEIQAAHKLAASHPRVPAIFSKPRPCCFVYSMGVNEDRNFVTCVVPSPPMGRFAGHFEGHLFVGVCVERYRRDIRKAYRKHLDAGEVVDIRHEEFYMLGLTPKNARSRPPKGEPHRVLHFCRVVACMTWATAWRRLRRALDATNPHSGFETYRLVLEPIEERDADLSGHAPGSRQGYRCRPGERLSGYRLSDLSPMMRRRIGKRCSQTGESWESDRDFEIDLTDLRRNEKPVTPDAAPGDICLVAEPYFFASEPEVEANGPLLLDDDIVETWSNLGAELAGAGRSSNKEEAAAAAAAAPSPQNPRCGKIGYGLLVDGRELVPLLHERIARRPRNPLRFFVCDDDSDEGCGGDDGDDSELRKAMDESMKEMDEGEEGMQRALAASALISPKKRKRGSGSGSSGEGESDEDLKRAIAMSLQQQNAPRKRSLGKSSSSSSPPPPPPPSSSSMSGVIKIESSSSSSSSSGGGCCGDSDS